MSISRKLSSVTNVFNGEYQACDTGFFWHHTPAYAGSEFSNRAGLQVFRTIYQHLRHRPNLKNLDKELKGYAEQLIEEGYVIINDVVPPDIFEKIQKEHNEGIDPGRSKVTVNTSGGVTGLFGHLDPGLNPNIVKYVLDNPKFLALISSVQGKKLKYGPGAWIHREFMNDGAERDTELNVVLHADVAYPTFKSFYRINRNDESNGALVMVPGSHKLDRKRMKHEYLFSIDQARLKKGKTTKFALHENGRMMVTGPVYKKEELKEVQLCSDPNSIVIANTMGFHRRGGSKIGAHRDQVISSFRYVESLHHKLYPRFGIDKSVRLKNRDLI